MCGTLTGSVSHAAVRFRKYLSVSASVIDHVKFISDALIEFMLKADELSVSCFNLPPNGTNILN